MHVWQIKELAADFADVWQTKELEEEDTENGKGKMEIGKGRQECSAGAARTQKASIETGFRGEIVRVQSNAFQQDRNVHGKTGRGRSMTLKLKFQYKW